MNPLHRHSLGLTLDALAESLFFQHDIPTTRRTAAARWIARRQGLPGSYAGMFAPTEHDASGFRLFTGEVVRTRAGRTHLLGEEACRVLFALGVNDPDVKSALDRAMQGMAQRLEEHERKGYDVGTYCCGTCSGGYWRNAALHLFPRSEERLELGLRALKQARCGGGQWRRFPFYYTSLALTEFDPALAKAEQRYAATRWRQILPRLSRLDTPLARRRAALGQRLLDLCES